MTGIELIAQKRAGHDAKGWTAEHDDTHTDGALAVASAVLALSGTGACVLDPLSDDDDWINTLCRKTEADRIEQLAIAGSLIAAEIDRLQRLARERRVVMSVKYFHFPTRFRPSERGGNRHRRCARVSAPAGEARRWRVLYRVPRSGRHLHERPGAPASPVHRSHPTG